MPSKKKTCFGAELIFPLGSLDADKPPRPAKQPAPPADLRGIPKEYPRLAEVTLLPNTKGEEMRESTLREEAGDPRTARGDAESVSFPYGIAIGRFSMLQRRIPHLCSYGTPREPIGYSRI